MPIPVRSRTEKASCFSKEGNEDEGEAFEELEKKFLAENSNDDYLKAIVQGDSESIRFHSGDINKIFKLLFCVKDDEDILEYRESSFTYLGYALLKMSKVSEFEKNEAYAVVKALLEKGVNPNTLMVEVDCRPDPENCSWISALGSGTAASLAIRAENLELLKLLFIHGACANSRNHAYEDLLAQAYDKENKELMDLIKEYQLKQRAENICIEEFAEIPLLNEILCPKDGQKVELEFSNSTGILDDAFQDEFRAI